MACTGLGLELGCRQIPSLAILDQPQSDGKERGEFNWKVHTHKPQLSPLTNGRPVDDQHIRVGQQHHIPHTPPHRHALLRPRRLRIRHHNAPACHRARLPRPRLQERPVLRAPAHQHLHHREHIPRQQRQHHGGSRARIIPRLPRNPRKRPDNHVSDVVVHDRVAVCEDEEVSVREQVDVRVEVVVLRVVGGVQEGEVEGACWIWGDVLDGESGAPADEDLAAVREELIRGVPAWLLECLCCGF